MGSIERARATLAATQRRLDRSEAALKRSAEWVARDQAAVDRAVMRAEQELRRLSPVPGELMELAAVLRQQIAVAAADLARTEEELARLHGELAVRDPSLSGEHLRAAEEARAAARLTRETGRRLAVK
jgi:hypothetical protein